MSCILFFDGACRGNPGPMAIGVILMKNGKKLGELSKYLGIGTNNIAEWRALIEGLKLAMAHECKELQVCGDSQLVINQIKGQYSVKSDNLVPLFKQAKKLCGNFKEIDFKWIKRKDNVRTDTLSNDRLDEKIKNKGRIYASDQMSKRS